MITEIMEMVDLDTRPRSIGVISLMGDEQSRLIRGRLLDAAGPEKMARHAVLIGSPPEFQGAERDVVFISMVCSPGSCPTQNQQFHFQRANVAMSRAKNRCVLVRSIDLKDIPSLDDSKIPILEFFMQASNSPKNSDAHDTAVDKVSSYKKRMGTTVLKDLLNERGYHLMDMGIVWKDAICVETGDSDTRAAILVDCEETSPQEWIAGFKQQKAIERVGWKCLRVDALSIAVDYIAVLEHVLKFLTSIGINVEAEREESASDRDDLVSFEDSVKMNAAAKKQDPEVIEIDDDDEVVPVSSGEDGHGELKPAAVAKVRPDMSKSSLDFGVDASMEASKFGEVVDLNFLIQRKESEDNDDLDPDDDFDQFMDDEFANHDRKSTSSSRSRISPPRAKKYRGSSSSDVGNRQSAKKRLSTQDEEDDEEAHVSGDRRKDTLEFATGTNADAIETSSQESRGAKRYKRRRLNKKSEDGYYYPRNSNNVNDDTVGCDTDSDSQQELQGDGDDDEDYEEEEIHDGMDEE
jgi:hypothetical protein